MMLASGLAAAAFLFQSAPSELGPKFDLSKDKVLYCIGYAHLDTQWRWDFKTTIDDYILDTLDDNFDRIEKYDGYVFNFTGSVRYEMMEEYYPEKFERLKKYIDEGRWFVSGSSVDEGDVNVPSPEANIRQVLYGNAYFKKEFGKESVDYMLPDCFGFPACMPTVWAHCGLKGFSTQKLTWGSAVGIPFKVGVWEGLDGSEVVAALDPGAYVGAIEGPVHDSKKWSDRITENGERYGVWADFHYYGVGDMGGAPKEKDVENYTTSQSKKDAPFKVALTSSDQLFRDLTEQQKTQLPRYRGDLLLTEHSAGTLTSQSYMKRWNRKNELLADSAERAAVIADWLELAKYPLEKLNRSWVRVLANQMHDILPGTSLPDAYQYSWNDEIVASNGFAAVLTDSVGAITRELNTEVKGTPLVVYNPLSIEREDVVAAMVKFEGKTPKAVRVFGPDGKEVPSQLGNKKGNSAEVLFVAKTPANGVAVFDVRESDSSFDNDGGLKIDGRTLENEKYRVTINDAGDIASIIDKQADGRELLREPSQLQFTFERPQNWPAWNMDWADRKQPIEGVVGGPAKIRVVEDGPVRVAIEIVREARDSVFTQTVRLARGNAGSRVEVVNFIDWQAASCALRASFPLTVSNPMATYNLGMGTLDRSNNEPKKYEVPAREWFDLTDKSGEYGVSILEDSKFGSDKPADDHVRLTLLYTPGVRKGYMDQHSQDWGRHDIVYGVYGHKGDWRKGESEWQGRRLNHPLVAFQAADKHDGRLGKSWSLCKANTSQVDIRAIKKAEEGDAVIVRLQELFGKHADNVAVEFNTPIASAYEVDGQERRIGDATFDGNRLTLSMTGFTPRSFAVRLAGTNVKSEPPKSESVKLKFDTDVASADQDRANGAMDSEGRTIPAEMLPGEIVCEGITFKLGSTASDKENAVTCNGQTIDLPSGDFDRVLILAAATEDTKGEFKVGSESKELSIQNWTGFIGQWDDRIWDKTFEDVDFTCNGKVVGFNKGFIKRDPVAWFATHRHHPTAGNESYSFSYLFKYSLEMPNGAKALTLPKNDKIRVFSVSVAKNVNDGVEPAQPLYDDLSNRSELKLRHKYPEPEKRIFDDVEAIGDVIIDRADSFESLKMGPPRNDDMAQAKENDGPMFRFDTVGGKYRPHGASGIVGESFPRLNDGEVAQNDDDVKRCVWYDSAGRFYIDLGDLRTIDSVNTYSWHVNERAPQYFSLWGANGDEMPSVDLKRGKTNGWELLGAVDSRDLGSGKKHGSSIRGKSGPLGKYRYLLWATEDMGNGTFFTEIDVVSAN